MCYGSQFDSDVVVLYNPNEYGEEIDGKFMDGFCLCRFQSSIIGRFGCGYIAWIDKISEREFYKIFVVWVRSDGRIKRLGNGEVYQKTMSDLKAEI